MTPADWHGCYDDNWNDLIVDEAFAHPAKFAPGLIRRIYRHGFERGYWTEGDLIGDPFGGIGGGGIIGSGMGLRWFGVELEPKFHALAEKNFAKWKHIEPCPRIVQGDSREFAKLVGECAAIVTSPPFAQQVSGGGIAAALQGESDYPTTISKSAGSRNQGYQNQGTTPGQIGNNKGDTYWQAMDAVYRQCYQSIKHGGVLACVIKDYVKGGKRVPLCDDTWTLLQACGFEPIERCRAMLVKEQRHNGLFGEVVERKERKSFFRRLAEKKGSPPIDWEEVLWVRKRAASWWLNNRGVDTPIREALDMFAVREGVSL